MGSNKFVWAAALLAVCIVTVAACPSYGESVAIVNAGFENLLCRRKERSDEEPRDKSVVVGPVGVAAERFGQRGARC